MSPDAFRRILDRFPRLRNLVLQGVGEPLLNPAFFRMVREARSRGVYVQTFTNGTLLGADDIPSQILDSGLNVLNISLDSCDREIYERMRRGAVFERVVEGVKTLAARVKAARAPLLLNLWIVRTEENRHTIRDTICFARTLGIRNIFLQPENSWGIRERDRPLPPGDEENVPALKALAKKNGIALNVLAGGGGKRRCQWPWYSTYITVEGFVTPCCMLGSDPRVLHFGNIHETPFPEIWNGREIRRFRAELKSGKPPEICAGCPGY